MGLQQEGNSLPHVSGQSAYWIIPSTAVIPIKKFRSYVVKNLHLYEG